MNYQVNLMLASQHEESGSITHISLHPHHTVHFVGQKALGLPVGRTASQGDYL
jgi:hypothetical protein